MVVALALLWALLAGVRAVLTLPPAPGAPLLLEAALTLLPGLALAGLAFAFLPRASLPPALPLEEAEARLASARAEAEGLEASLVRLDARLAAITTETAALASAAGSKAKGLGTQAEALARHVTSLATDAEGARTVAEGLAQLLPGLATSVETIRSGLTTLGEDSAVQLRAVEAMLGRVHSQNDEATSRADAAIAALASHFARLDEASKESTAAIAKRTYALDAAVDGVLERVETSMAGIADQLAATLARLDTGLDGAGRQLTLLGDEGVRLFGQRLDALIDVSQMLDGQFAGHSHAATALHASLADSIAAAQTLATPLAAASETLARLDASQQALVGQSADLAATLAGQLAEADAALARFAAGAEALDASGLRLTDTVAAAAETLGEATATLEAGDARLAALAATLVEHFAAARTTLAGLETAADGATSNSQRAAEQLTARLLGLVETISQTEARIDAVETRFVVRERNTLARDASGLMAGLSASVGDIAHLLQIDVPDADWQSWLRGDRSALPAIIRPLLDDEEQRRISRHVAHDPAFRVETTRFLDQFERLIARLLGDRDGDALAATMLSADIGKLYIRLADAAGRIH
jgi:hypothetical protein